ncbi:MAG: type 1 glutamine amidotransferase [Holophagae bacterium]|jgi:GMP synthase (glutamine-hydrolysing)
MFTPRTYLRLVLLQVRSELISLKQEQSCFIERCRVARRQFTFINLVDEPHLGWQQVANAHAVIIGGAGAFSVTKRHPFTDPLRDVVSQLIDADRPVFGACWGHQFLADLGGGTVIEDKQRAEIGSFPIELTDAGRNDELFEGFPERFHVQLGHNDRVRDLGPGWLELARSERCPHQAIRLTDRPVYGTQFHSEMNEERLRERLLVFLEDYVGDEAAYQLVLRRLRPSVEADRLIETFLRRFA